ncbi:hypothetical protein LI90_4259 [Carbonactinospora thermoautotrophica]|uniref:Uncharacterized protein n=1 Tax=Carbonactinospora thermoautotrophica TaxID=1469144 RepID=A0A132MZ80_9ACTN|nr:hypothetical protein [Carbonactinospora thermoautotrophica]KWX03208.1 hypothetical protein LI90_4259 [Carbonactinospora thermoautotrophica]
MRLDLRTALGYGADHPGYVLAAAALTVVALAILARLVRALGGAGAQAGQEAGEQGGQQDETGSKTRLEDVITFVAAIVATGVSLQGMWEVFSDKLSDVPAWLRVVLFGFIELAMLASALRARRNIRETGDGDPGLDATAVRVLTAITAILSCLDAGSLVEGLLRLVAPAIAAFLWERFLAIEQRRVTGRERRIHWRVTPERIAVWLGLAEAYDRTASEVDAHRRLARLARAAKRVRTLNEARVTGRRLRKALAELDRAMEDAVEYAGLATDPTRQQQLMDYIGALYSAATLADLNPHAPWHPAAPPVEPGALPRLVPVPIPVEPASADPTEKPTETESSATVDPTGESGEAMPVEEESTPTGESTGDRDPAGRGSTVAAVESTGSAEEPAVEPAVASALPLLPYAPTVVRLATEAPTAEVFPWDGSGRPAERVGSAVAVGLTPTEESTGAAPVEGKSVEPTRPRVRAVAVGPTRPRRGVRARVPVPPSARSRRVKRSDEELLAAARELAEQRGVPAHELSAEAIRVGLRIKAGKARELRDRLRAAAEESEEAA